MSEYKIITISRQFGSGGHEIGEKLADRLGIPLYDNQLVTMAAEKTGAIPRKALGAQTNPHCMLSSLPTAQLP